MIDSTAAWKRGRGIVEPLISADLPGGRGGQRLDTGGHELAELCLRLGPAAHRAERERPQRGVAQRDDALADAVDEVGLELPAAAQARVELRTQERRREVVQAPGAGLPHDAQRAVRTVLVAAAQHDVGRRAIAARLDPRHLGGPCRRA